MSVEVFRKHLKWQAFPVPSRQVHGHESEGSEVRCWSFVHGSHSHLEYLFLVLFFCRLLSLLPLLSLLISLLICLQEQSKYHWRLFIIQFNRLSNLTDCQMASMIDFFQLICTGRISISPQNPTQITPPPPSPHLDLLRLLSLLLDLDLLPLVSVSGISISSSIRLLTELKWDDRWWCGSGEGRLEDNWYLKQEIQQAYCTVIHIELKWDYLMMVWFRGG